MKTRKPVYLDCNSTTRIHPKALETMMPFLKEDYGNSSSLHKKGSSARAALESARAVIGDALGTEGVDIIFTSGGTESDNLAIKGICQKNRGRGKHIITSSIEHMAVLEACRFVQAQDFDITYLPVDRYGMVDPLDVKKAVNDHTILVSIMHANNEVGTIQPIREISEIIREINENRETSVDNRKPSACKRIYIHTDAVQTFGKIPIDVDALGVDLLSMSAHKLYGPKGIGALYIRKSTQISSFMHGGHQERDLRAGTVNVAGVVGFAKAVEISRANFKDKKRQECLRDKLYRGLLRSIKGIILNGHPDNGLYNTLNLCFEGVNSTSLIASLDLKGIFVSAGSACIASSPEPSHVLKAMHVPEEYIKSCVRFSMGADNTDEDITYCVQEIPEIINRLRRTHS
ncbi:MAG: cysteine desulfurase [Dehalococcoidia bacterium]|nr:MAG: cysteine desulfurase [Dehalococcoidia bacterium]